MPPGGQGKRMLAAARARRQPERVQRTAAMVRAVAGWRSGLGHWWAARNPRQRQGLSVGAGMLVLGLVAVLVTGLTASSPAPRSRQYLAFTACLLTDSHGIASGQAASVWAGMEQASLATHAKAQYFPVMAGPTEGAAEIGLNTLLVRKCRVVLATGAAEVAAVNAEAGRYPSVRFAVAGGPARGAHVTALAGSGRVVQAAADQLVTAAVQQSG